jgi:hypothetical protein
LVGK